MPFFIQQTLLNLSHFSPLCFTLGRDFIKTPPDKFCCISRLNCFQERKAVILGDNTYQCRGDIHLSEDRVEVRQLLLLQFSAYTDCSLGFVSLTTNNVKISVSSSNLAQLLVRQVVSPSVVSQSPAMPVTCKYISEHSGFYKFTYSTQTQLAVSQFTSASRCLLNTLSGSMR